MSGLAQDFMALERAVAASSWPVTAVMPPPPGDVLCRLLNEHPMVAKAEVLGYSECGYGGEHYYSWHVFLVNGMNFGGDVQLYELGSGGPWCLAVGNGWSWGEGSGSGTTPDRGKPGITDISDSSRPGM